HAMLGEEVAAAVVLREGHAANERDIRDFVAARLADFKVPRKVVILDEIPKGATGKLQRIGLAAKLGLPRWGCASLAPARSAATSPPSSARRERLICRSSHAARTSPRSRTTA